MKIVIDGKEVYLPSSSGGSLDEVYSTEEVRIGTWIDGKPLYRKGIKFSNVFIDTTYRAVLEISDANIETFVKYSGMFTLDGDHSFLQLPIPFIQVKDPSTSQEITSLWNGSTKKWMVHGRWESIVHASGIIFFEYTKTTD